MYRIRGIKKLKMKKYQKAAIVFMIFLLTACGKQGNPIVLPDREEIVSIDVSDTVTFQATVIEKNNDSILVRPVDGSLELNSADEFSILNEKELELQVGDLIEITYNGDIMESYPAQLGEVYEITVIERAEAN